MNRIDFHIHTVATASDSKGFTFDPDVLKEYVERSDLAGIAITNHNNFYRDNFEQVVDMLDIPVFPGAELNITTAGSFGHVLVIADLADIDDFSSGMETFASECSGESSHVSWDRVV